MNNQNNDIVSFSNSGSGSNCCPCGPGGGGEVHWAWDGFDTDRPNLIRWYMIWDDNFCLKPDITEPQTPTDPSEIFDHYAIEWIEQQLDGSVHAILSEREQVCLWPGTTVAKRVFNVGSPIGASFRASCNPLKGRKCGNCKVDTTWCRYNIKIKQNELISLLRYGGLAWENYKYVAEQYNHVMGQGSIIQTLGSGSGSGSGSNEIPFDPNNPYMGFTGPIGKGATIFSGFRLEEDPQNNTIDINPYISDLTSGTNSHVFSKMLTMAERIQELKDSGLLNLEFGGPTITYRQSIWPNTAAHGSDDPCCNGSDLDYLHDNECDGMCCSDGIEVKYIIPTSSLECYIKNNGNLIKTNVSVESLSFIPSNYIPVNNPVSVNALTEVLLSRQIGIDQDNNPIISNIPLEDYPTIVCDKENTYCFELSSISPITNFSTIEGYAVETTFSVSANELKHKIRIKNPAIPNFIQELDVSSAFVKPIVIGFESGGCQSLSKVQCVEKGFTWNTNARDCNSSTCCS